MKVIHPIGESNSATRATFLSPKTRKSETSQRFSAGLWNEESERTMASAAAMSSVNLTDLPEELLYEIVSYLGYADQVNLASTHPYLRFLRPRVQTVEGWDSTPMDVPIIARGLIAVKLSLRRSTSFVHACMLQLIRDGEVSFSRRYTQYNPSTEVVNHPVVTKAKKGDIMRVNCVCVESMRLIYKR